MLNKKMRDILTEMEQKHAAARQAQKVKDFAKAKELVSEIQQLQDEYELEEKLFMQEQKKSQNGKAAGAGTEMKACGFVAMAKLLTKGKKLNDAEKALLYGDDGAETPKENDENLLVPEDVQVAINEARRSYKSAKDYVTVIPVATLSGSMNFETGEPAGLVDFEDGDVLNEENEPTFDIKKWAIKFKGKLIKIGRILLGAEKAGLMAYLNKWFIKNAVVSENKDIFDCLKEGKETVSFADWKALKSHINKKLDPSALIDGVIITNQDGFDILDSAEDKNGRPILTPNPKDETIKMFKGLEIAVFANAQLPSTASGAPVFVGDTRSGCFFMEKQGLEFAVSEHRYFDQNTNALRVIEGYDTLQADADAYFYGELKLPTA